MECFQHHMLHPPHKNATTGPLGHLRGPQGVLPCWLIFISIHYSFRSNPLLKGTPKILDSEIEMKLYWNMNCVQDLGCRASSEFWRLKEGRPSLCCFWPLGFVDLFLSIRRCVLVQNWSTINRYPDSTSGKRWRIISTMKVWFYNTMSNVGSIWKISENSSSWCLCDAWFSQYILWTIVKGLVEE
jgi:hypothetical protein